MTHTMNRLVNVFGSLGYTALAVQWLWSMLIISIPYVDNDSFRGYMMPAESSSTPTPLVTDIPEPVATVLMLVVVLFAISISIYAIIAVPRSAGKAGGKATKVAVQAAVPKISKHKKLTKKERIGLSERLTWGVKALLVVLPLLLSLLPIHDAVPLDRDVVIAASILLAIISLLWFTLQFIVVKIYKIDPANVW